MSKPIFVINMAGDVDILHARQAEQYLSSKMPDWHIVVFCNPQVVENTFHAFSDQNATKIDIEAIRQPIEELIKQLSNKQ